MSRRGDDDGFHPHPGDPWHPGWASGDEVVPEVEPSAEADGAGPGEVGPGEPAPAPESRRRRFGRGRRRERPKAGVAEKTADEPAEDALEQPAPEEAEPAGWWATRAVPEAGTGAGGTATAPGDTGDADGEDEESPPALPLFPWWAAAAPPEAPASAEAPARPGAEALGEEPAGPGREPGAASMVPLDLPARPEVAPPWPVAPDEAGGGWWEEAAGPATPLDLPARPEVAPAEADVEAQGLESLLAPVTDPDAASVAADLAQAAAALLAEMGEEPVVEPLEALAGGDEEEDLLALSWVAESAGSPVEVGVGEEPLAAGGVEPSEEDLPALSWVAESAGSPVEVGVGEEPLAAGGVEPSEEDLPALSWVAESAGSPVEVGVGEEPLAAGGVEPPEEDLPAQAWALEASPAGGEEDLGIEPPGLVLASWDPGVDAPVAGTAAPAAGSLPALAEDPTGDSGMPTLEAEVDEWLAFVEGIPAGAAAAARRGAVPAITPAAVPEFEIEAEPPLPSAARPRRKGWFGRRRRAASGEEGWPERAWAAEAAAAEEEGHQPPPWTAAGEAALPPEDAVAAPVQSEEAEAEAAWEAWQSAEAAGAPEAEAAPPGAMAPESSRAEQETSQAGAVLGEYWPGPGPADAAPPAGVVGDAAAVDEDEELWEEGEWTGEPEAVTGWPAEVDEDEVEVPPAGLPEEEWETGEEPVAPAVGRPQSWPGFALQPSEASEPEAELGAELEAELESELDAEPEAEPDEEWAAAGWEVFPEPGEPLPREAGARPGAWEPLTAQPTEPVDAGLATAGWETFPEPGRRPPRWPEDEAGGSPVSAFTPQASFPGPAAPVFPAPYPAGAEPTMEIPPPDVFDFERAARRQGPISEEILSGAVTMEHRGLAEEVAAADTAETELQALSAPMPGLESGVVGFEDVAHLSSDEEMAAPVRSDLPVRVVTGMVLAALLLGSLWVGGEFFAGFVGLLVMLGLGEFYGSLRRSGYQPLALFGFLGGSGLLIGTWFFGPVAIPIAVVATTVVSFFYYAFAPHRRDALTNGGLTVLGMLWVTGTAAFAFPIAASPEFRVLVLAVAATVIATDVGAFFAGRAWGARPMAPVLSPRKTWEGLAGGVVLGIGVAVAAGYFFDPIGMRAGAALGLVVAIMAPLGDLAESMVKRSLGIKDMGTTLPGHGGILDRVDAFLFVLPAAWVLFETMGLLR